MNIVIENGIVFFHCHNCDTELTVADIIKVDDNILCRSCEWQGHLGYEKDLNENNLSWVLNYL